MNWRDALLSVAMVMTLPVLGLLALLSIPWIALAAVFWQAWTLVSLQIKAMEMGQSDYAGFRSSNANAENACSSATWQCST